MMHRQPTPHAPQPETAGPADPSLRPDDLARHARLGIDAGLLGRAGIRRVTDAQAREALTSKHPGDLAGILYPYIHPRTGRMGTCRVRRDRPEIENGKPKDKYVSAWGDARHLFFPPGADALLEDVTVPVALVESEKAALTVTAVMERRGRPTLAIATGGVGGWRGRIGKTTDAHGQRVDERGPSADFSLITWSGRPVILLSDANVPGNVASMSQRRQLGDYLVTLGARVSIADVPVEDGINGPDDYVGAHGDDALWVLLDGARPLQPATAADALRLAGLDVVGDLTVDTLEPRLRILRDSLRGADAIRRRTVRELLITKLKEAKVTSAAALADAAIGAGDAAADEDLGAEFLRDDEPWPDPVDGAALLAQLVTTIRHYIILGRDAAVAVALWCVLTYFDAVVSLLPLLLITSPSKRCGKTKTVEVVSGLARRALSVSNISAAALYRSIDRFHPTLLVDEADTFVRDDPELVGVINAGHTRHTARVVRCVGEDSEPRVFSTWCPKLLAMIGRPKDTLLDRSIVIALERKAAGDRVARLRADQVPVVFRDLRRQMRRWTDDHAEAMRQADPPMPAGLHDRALDNYRPLLAIAQLAGADWLAMATAAAQALAGTDGDDDPIGEQLLADLRVVFDDAATEDLKTADVAERLKDLDSRPWASYGRKTGKPITQFQLASLLKRFGIKPTKTWCPENRKTVNCYLRTDLEGAWARYTPVQVGRLEDPNVSGPESPISGWKATDAPSNPETAQNSIKTGLLPTFQPDSPSPGREVVDL